MTALVAEETHAAAILAALNAVLPADKQACDSDDLEKLPALPLNYVEITVSRRYGAQQRAAGGASAAGWRITTRAVSQTSITNARAMARLVSSALENASLSIGGALSTPVLFESAEPIGDDDGWWSGLTSWTYVA